MSERAAQVLFRRETRDAQSTAALAEPDDERERRMQALRVATVGEQHSAPLGGLHAKQLERKSAAHLKVQIETQLSRKEEWPVTRQEV